MSEKYEIGIMVRRSDAWYEIMDIRIVEGKKEYQLCGLPFWSSETELGKVMEKHKV